MLWVLRKPPQSVVRYAAGAGVKHSIRIVDDTAVLAIQGTLDLEILEELYAQAEQHILTRYPHYFTLTDATQLTGISSAARKRGAEWPSPMQHGGGNVVYGAGIVARTLLTMAVRATTLFRRQPALLTFAASEQEAWAWIARRRQELGQLEPRKP